MFEVLALVKGGEEDCSFDNQFIWERVRTRPSIYKEKKIVCLRIV